MVFSQRSCPQSRQDRCHIALHTQRSKTLSPISTISVAGTPVSLSSNIKILGVTLDNTLSFDNHVSRSCYYHICALRHIRPSIGENIFKMIACSMVCCRLDYANSVFLCTSAKVVHRLERIQNTLAGVVTRQHDRTSISATLQKLHWLPVK